MKKVSAGIVCRNGKILICQRPKGKSLAGFWEFPGGKLEEGESLQDCLKRELKEELDIEIAVGDFFMESVYQYEFGEISLNAYFATLSADQEPVLKEHPQLVWINPKDLGAYAFAPADLPIVEALKKYFLK